MRQMLVLGHNLGLTDEAGSRGASITREQKTRTVSTCWINPGGFLRDGPNTTTTILLQRSFASDVTSNRHLMAHQMKNLCLFSVLHCVEGAGAFDASSRGTQNWKWGSARWAQNGCGCVWAVPFSGSFCHPQPPGMLILLPEPGSERKFLTKETCFSLLREWKSSPN